MDILPYSVSTIRPTVVGQETNFNTKALQMAEK